MHICGKSIYSPKVWRRQVHPTDDIRAKLSRVEEMIFIGNQSTCDRKDGHDEQRYRVRRPQSPFHWRDPTRRICCACWQIFTPVLGRVILRLFRADTRGGWVASPIKSMFAKSQFVHLKFVASRKFPVSDPILTEFPIWGSMRLAPAWFHHETPSPVVTNHLRPPPLSSPLVFNGGKWELKGCRLKRLSE